MEHTNLILRIKALDPTFSGTPQEFVDHFVERAEILSPSGFFNVIIADVAPNSNEGLLLLGGDQIYVWNNDQGKYVPFDITPSLYLPSIPDVLTGKWVLISEGGEWRWIKSSEFMAWIGGNTLGNIPLGPSGTIMSSLATVDWRTPANALPDGTVPVAKLQATPEDVNRVAKVGSSGVVSWQNLPTLAAAIHFTPLANYYAIPAYGENLPIARPDNAVLLKIVLVKVNDDPTNTNYPLNVEINVCHFVTLGESSGGTNSLTAFVVEELPSSWTLVRHPDTGHDNRIRMLNNNNPPNNSDDPNGFHYYIDPANWKVKAYWF